MHRSALFRHDTGHVSGRTLARPQANRAMRQIDAITRGIPPDNGMALTDLLPHRMINYCYVMH
jgi:hypothetical protein